MVRVHQVSTFHTSCNQQLRIFHAHHAKRIFSTEVDKIKENLVSAETSLTEVMKKLSQLN